MLSLSIKITGNKQLIQKLTRLGSSLYDFKGAMGQIGAEGAKYYSTQGFASQGGVFGNRWPSLSAKYAAIKAKLYPGRPMLVATGNMQNSFTYAASSNSVLIGNKADYFKYHQSTLPRTKMPRRASMGVNAPVKRMVRDILQADVRRKIQSM